MGRPDLHVTSAVLEEMRAALTSATSTLDQARRLLAAADPAVAGAVPLVSQAEQYAASWRYGITQLGQHTHGCVQDLTQIAAAFTAADQHLAGVVRGTGPAQPGPGGGAVTGNGFPALGFDPAPGDPAGVRYLGRTIGRLAHEVTGAAGTLSGAGSQDWTGSHADAFRTHLHQDVVPLIQTAATSFGQAAAALGRWATLLDGFAAEAVTLERRAAAAQQDQQAAARTLAAFTTAHGPPSASGLRRQADLHAAAGPSGSGLDAIRGQARELNTRYLAAAGRVAGQLTLAGDMTPRAPGLLASWRHDLAAGWDDARDAAGDWVRDHVALLEFISGVLNLIATVSAVLALIPPLSFVFGFLAIAAAGAATLDDTLVAMFAHGSWAIAGLDLAGTLTAGGAFRAAGELAEIYQGTGRGKQMWTLVKFGGSEAKVAPGLFRSIAHMTDEAWAMKAGTKEFSWRIISTVCGQVSWTATGIAGTTVPGTVRTWRDDLMTGRQPWREPAPG